MKPTILQRLLFFVLLIAALVLGFVVASGFLLLAILLIPVLLIRFYLYKKKIESVIKSSGAQRKAQANDASQGEQEPSTQREAIEGEVLSKREDDSKV